LSCPLGAGVGPAPGAARGSSSRAAVLLGAAGTLLAIVATAGIGCAGPKHAQVAGPARACTIATTIGGDKPVKDRVYPAEYWFALLLQGYQMSGELARPARTCAGSPVALEMDGCAGMEPATHNPPAVSLSPRDLVVMNLGDARRLVWAITDRLSDGQAEGPVALAEIEPQGIAVRVSGSLRAYPENASLRLARLGAGTVLVAEGEVCAKPGLCERATRVVPMIGEHFVAKPLVDDQGACLGPAFFPVRQGGVAHGRKHAKYEVQVSITYGPDNIAIREQLALSGAEPVSDPSTGSFVTRVQAERQLTFKDGNLVATAPSVLARWLSSQ
jgi:hypothetical protein